MPKTKPSVMQSLHNAHDFLSELLNECSDGNAYLALEEIELAMEMLSKSLTDLVGIKAAKKAVKEDYLHTKGAAAQELKEEEGEDDREDGSVKRSGVSGTAGGTAFALLMQAYADQVVPHNERKALTIDIAVVRRLWQGMGDHSQEYYLEHSDINREDCALSGNPAPPNRRQQP